jgi:HK97 gp10 family phage protein
MLRFQITGQTELAKALQGLPARVRVEVAMEAMSKAVQPVVDAAKALAPVGETGALRESIGFAVRQYKKGRITFGVVGARRGFGVPDPGSSTGTTEPANYAHLVEYGHAVAGDAGNYVEAQPFLRPAWDMTAPTVLALLGQELGKGIAAQAAISARRAGSRRKK